jgi:hypothetical protein
MIFVSALLDMVCNYTSFISQLQGLLFQVHEDYISGCDPVDLLIPSILLIASCRKYKFVGVAFFPSISFMACISLIYKLKKPVNRRIIPEM